MHIHLYKMLDKVKFVLEIQVKLKPLTSIYTKSHATTSTLKFANHILGIWICHFYVINSL